MNDTNSKLSGITTFRRYDVFKNTSELFFHVTNK